jgi:hypothetical protein
VVVVTVIAGEVPPVNVTDRHEGADVLVGQRATKVTT